MKKILLTGATGYIGKRLLPTLLNEGYHVICCTRDLSRFSPPENTLEGNVEVIEVDFLKKETLKNIPDDIDGAYYLLHSMSSGNDYEEMERNCANNFRERINNTNCEHVLYLTGLANANKLSKHLSSRKKVEDLLAKGEYNFTALRAGIIIGSGSASFEIIRDLVEKLPLMITPVWLKTKCQPIGIIDVLAFLTKSLFNERLYNDSFDIGSPNVLSYREMLLEYANVRGLKRHIGLLPLMSPKFSSYWLYFITSTSYQLASSLVDSMKVKVVCRKESLEAIKEATGVEPITYREALEQTLEEIKSENIISSWKDSFSSSRHDTNLTEYIEVPEHGCFIDERSVAIDDKENCINRVFGIGGQNGWYGQKLWVVRGYIDNIFGGVGLNRGRTHPTKVHTGDSIDFWRVLHANREEGKLILFAEMKLPGEAWLSFEVKEEKLYQKATFRPKGLAGRLYWYSVLPFHGFIFKGMAKRLAQGK